MDQSCSPKKVTENYKKSTSRSNVEAIKSILLP